MPPTFVYLVCLVIWVFSACAVWIAAGLMCLVRKSRVFSRPLCFAMAATFPFVVAYQIIAAPFVAVVLAVAWVFWRIVEPGTSIETQNPFVIAGSIAAIFLSFGAMLAMSVAGFYEGWRIGWAFATGRSFHEALSDGLTVKLLARLSKSFRFFLPSRG